MSEGSDISGDVEAEVAKMTVDAEGRLVSWRYIWGQKALPVSTRIEIWAHRRGRLGALLSVIVSVLSLPRGLYLRMRARGMYRGMERRYNEMEGEFTEGRLSDEEIGKARMAIEMARVLHGTVVELQEMEKEDGLVGSGEGEDDVTRAEGEYSRVISEVRDLVGDPKLREMQLEKEESILALKLGVVAAMGLLIGVGVFAWSPDWVGDPKLVLVGAGAFVAVSSTLAVWGAISAWRRRRIRKNDELQGDDEVVEKEE